MKNTEKNRSHLTPEGIDRKSPSPVYLQVSNQLKKELMLGNYKEGDRFFSYRKLKEIYGIELKTASEAVDLLIKEKFLLKKPASGTYVANLNKAASNGVFTGNIWYVLIGGESFDHPYYFRLLKSIERSIDPTGLKLIVGIKESFNKFNSWFTPGPGDGAILTGDIDNKNFLESVNKRIDGRLAILGAYRNIEATANISIDIEGGIMNALEKMLPTGIKSLGVIAGRPDKNVTNSIIETAKAFSRKHNIDIAGSYTDEDEDGYKGMEYLESKQADCVIATEPAYFGVCRYAVSNNIKCPGKLKIIRYGKEPQNKIYDDFASINIYSDTERMGKLAVEMLLEGKTDKIKMKMEVD
jgi:DNA-binding LacI/PurR family transcriptional regulator